MDEPTIIKQENELLQLVTFGIGEEEFGIDILKVQEIIRTMELKYRAKLPSLLSTVKQTKTPVNILPPRRTILLLKAILFLTTN